ncbi:hypothetical protein HL658_04360 [Azospirillum sp. RWY-5-1]|uniref:Magnesium transporter MgtE intracellular domain-containing protein n=1 Tax=Azospirillum oleiclasticum TaxID=2735135 RepID=A0ABX2T3N5_9PROT|nr:hypothetical protein [Azospirillum oleiclasticum]NYZ11772.1 hypothetical protein [Azospirillum oleiclasticum]NYZ18932.1 hypothetical protein [Azospirillum oleiclasticum]
MTTTTTLDRKPPATTADPAAPARRPAVGKPPVKATPTGKMRRKPAREPLARRLVARARGLRFRLLPVTIFVAVLMLGLRVGDLWRIATRDAQLPEFPVTLAQAPSPPAQQPQQPAPAAPGAAARPPEPSPGPAAAGGERMAAANPLGPVDNNELLQHYADRRAEIERRTKEVEQREALLAAAEKRIDQKLQELEKVRGEIQKLLRTGDQRQSEQLDSLVKIYETMKPKEAARIFEELEMPVLLDVITRMKETKTAPVLAAMDPSKAKAITAALVERRALPAVPQ